MNMIIFLIISKLIYYNLVNINYFLSKIFLLADNPAVASSNDLILSLFVAFLNTCLTLSADLLIFFHKVSNNKVSAQNNPNL